MCATGVLGGVIAVFLLSSVTGQRIHTVEVGESRYFVSNASPYSPQLNWFLAYQYCRTIGMELLSLERLEEIEHLTAYLADNRYLDSDYWTSGNQLGSEMWIWMSTGQPYNTTFNFWATNGPPLTKSQQSCMSTRREVWAPKNCMESKPFVCEQTRCFYYNYVTSNRGSTQGNSTVTPGITQVRRSPPLSGRPSFNPTRLRFPSPARPSSPITVRHQQPSRTQQLQPNHNRASQFVSNRTPIQGSRTIVTHRPISGFPASSNTTISPLKVMTTTSPLKVMTTTSPLKVMTTTSPLKVMTTTSPLKVMTTPSPFKTMTPPSHFKHMTTSSSIKVMTTLSPLKDMTSPSPFKAMTPPTNLKVMTTTSQLNNITTPSPLKVMPASQQPNIKEMTINNTTVEVKTMSQTGPQQHTIKVMPTTSQHTESPANADNEIIPSDPTSLTQFLQPPTEEFTSIEGGTEVSSFNSTLTDTGVLSRKETFSWALLEDASQ